MGRAAWPMRRWVAALIWSMWGVAERGNGVQHTKKVNSKLQSMSNVTGAEKGQKKCICFFIPPPLLFNLQ
jgi:hypothetical protein